ncbi:MAG: VPGUxxT family thioredoxin-like (seleno)protein, type 2 [Planctomycetota bacterium]
MSHQKQLLFLAIIAFPFSLPAFGQDASSQKRNPVEIGTVNWGRDLDAAFMKSSESGKPVFLLFQEVPGCAGCQKFGREVLSHPLVVEAIEDEFVPVVVFNNRSTGEDKKILKRFNEPAWNYQVIRFLDENGHDIVQRKEGIWSIGGVASRMVETLEERSRSVPKYLTSLASLGSTNSQDVAAFAMHCFWTGEYRLGGIDGVVATEAGWLDGREVTLVRYDKSTLNLESLARQAAKVECADKIYTSQGLSLARLRAGKLDKSYRPASAADQKRQIARWKALASVPGINAMQLTKINALAPDNMTSAIEWLSPRQRKALGGK